MQTNCGIESWHGRLNHELPYPHPELEQLSRILKNLDDEKLRDVELNQNEMTNATNCKLQRWQKHSGLIYAQMEQFLGFFPISQGAEDRPINRSKQTHKGTRRVQKTLAKGQESEKPPDAPPVTDGYSGDIYDLPDTLDEELSCVFDNEQEFRSLIEGLPND